MEIRKGDIVIKIDGVKEFQEMLDCGAFDELWMLLNLESGGNDTNMIELTLTPEQEDEIIDLLVESNFFPGMKFGENLDTEDADDSEETLGQWFSFSLGDDEDDEEDVDGFEITDWEGEAFYKAFFNPEQQYKHGDDSYVKGEESNDPFEDWLDIHGADQTATDAPINELDKERERLWRRFN